MRISTAFKILVSTLFSTSILVSTLFSTSILVSGSGIPGRGGKNGKQEIIGGVVVRPANKYPFIVNILYDGEMHCGGTMVGPSTIVTASHCTMGIRDRPIPVSSLSVFVNRYNMTKKPEEESKFLYTISIDFKSTASH
jgi:secreted trypsin-like serine protease